MKNFYHTYRTISKILDLDFNSSDDSKEVSRQGVFNWDKIIPLASSHLVLPTIYYNLKKKDLLAGLPLDLTSFLKEIAELNSHRNSLILKQIIHISKLFKKEGIEFVFLKGAALLGMGAYENTGERMIGDIDILVSYSSIEKAFGLLLKNGYSILQNTPGYSNLTPKHKPRIVHENEDYVCAVEIHNRLFENFDFPELNNKNIITNRVMSKDIWTPKLEHLFLHNILNWQVNDNGILKKSIGFRSIYDHSLFIKKDIHLIKSKWLNEAPFSSYLSLYSILYPNFKIKTNLKLKLDRVLFIGRLKSPFLRYLWHKTIKIKLALKFLSNRAGHFIRNEKYRKAILLEKNNSLSKLKKTLKK